MTLMTREAAQIASTDTCRAGADDIQVLQVDIIFVHRANGCQMHYYY